MLPPVLYRLYSPPPRQSPHGSRPSYIGRAEAVGSSRRIEGLRLSARSKALLPAAEPEAALPSLRQKIARDMAALH